MGRDSPLPYTPYKVVSPPLPVPLGPVHSLLLWDHRGPYDTGPSFVSPRPVTRHPDGCRYRDRPWGAPEPLPGDPDHRRVKPLNYKSESLKGVFWSSVGTPKRRTGRRVLRREHVDGRVGRDSRKVPDRGPDVRPRRVRPSWTLEVPNNSSPLKLLTSRLQPPLKQGPPLPGLEPFFCLPVDVPTGIPTVSRGRRPPGGARVRELSPCVCYPSRQDRSPPRVCGGGLSVGLRSTLKPPWSRSKTRADLMGETDPTPVKGRRHPHPVPTRVPNHFKPVEVPLTTPEGSRGTSCPGPTSALPPAPKGGCDRTCGVPNPLSSRSPLSPGRGLR